MYDNRPDDRIMRLVGQWLLEWRRSTGATQRLVASAAGISQAHLSRIERGLRRPSGVGMGRILLALDWLSHPDRDPRGPWAVLDGPLPSRAARWRSPRPPAFIGREPLAVAALPDADELLAALLDTA